MWDYCRLIMDITLTVPPRLVSCALPLMRHTFALFYDLLSSRLKRLSLNGCKRDFSEEIDILAYNRWNLTLKIID
jgi:hypothetical protein